MKSILVYVAADSNAELQWRESGLVRRVILSGAVRTTASVAFQAMLRRGPGSNNALANGDQNVIAAGMLATSAAFTTDVPCYERVNEGDKWHITAKVIAGSAAEEYALATVYYEAVRD